MFIPFILVTLKFLLFSMDMIFTNFEQMNVFLVREKCQNRRK